MATAGQPNSMMTNLLNAFRQGTPAAAPNPGVPTPAGTSQIPSAAPNNPGADPTNQTLAPAVPAATQSPLDAFKDLWQTDSTKAAANAANDLSAPLFKIDPAKLQASASKIDFTKSVPPELITKALGGDAQSFLQVLNLVAQQNYLLGTHLTTNMIDQGLAKNNDRFTNSLPATFKNLQVNENMSVNPAMNHPATRPLFEAVHAQFTKNYPMASAAEITAHAQNYLQNIAKVITDANPAQVDPNAKKAPAEMDWSVFLDNP